MTEQDARRAIDAVWRIESAARKEEELGRQVPGDIVRKPASRAAAAWRSS
jgi:hypothetical protein